jgi:hypothetical protein
MAVTKRVGLIVIEGADATGKTTLSAALEKMYGAKVLHLTYNKDVAGRMFDYQTEGLLESVNMSNNHLVVVERHWISECVYASTFRNGSPWPYMGRMMDRVINKHGGIYVLCMPKTIKEGVEMHNRNIDQDHPYDDEKFRELLFRYDRLYYGCRAPSKFTEEDYCSWITKHGGLIKRPDVDAYRMSMQGTALDLYCFTLVEKVNMRRLLQYQPALDPKDHNVLGHVFKAKWLMIGEEINNKNTPYNWPFYEHNNSSLFLTNMLQELNVKEEELMWVNSVGPDGYMCRHIPALVKQGLKPICFGRKAEATTRTLLDGHRIKANIYTVMHPAHAMRFLKGMELMNDLKEIFNGTGG